MIGLLLIGSGAREVAIARKIKESSSSTLLYCIASTTNPQIKNLSKLYFEQSPSEVSSVLELIKNHLIECVQAKFGGLIQIRLRVTDEAT